MFCVVILVMHFINVAKATHFRGGTISWNAESGNIVQFHFRLAWELGRGGCDGTKKGAYVTSLATEKWSCTSGCPGLPDVGDNSYYCTEVDVAEGWEQGEKRFTYTLPGKGPYTVGYSGRNWMPLDYGASGVWNLQTSIDLRSRSDTGLPNRSPVTSSLPVYTLPLSCTSTIRIPVFDEDNDTIKCRWSRGTECGSICNMVPSIPSGQLDTARCTLTIDLSAANNYSDGGIYAVAVTVEDFPKTSLLLDGIVVSPATALSSVPLQFLLKTDFYPMMCSDAPRFLDTPPDRTTYVIPDGHNWKLKIYVQGTRMTVLEHITISGPHDLIATKFQPDDKGRSGVKYVDLTWTPTQAEKGVNIVCLRAYDDHKKPSEQKCFILLAGAPDPCDSNPCLHGGSCSIKFDTYECACPSGVTGSQCETDIDECLASPCGNGGVCSNTIGSYQCFCVQGFIGQNCTEVDHCAANPCQGHGQCIETGTTYICSCYSGFTGVHCDTDIDDCASAPCLNGAVCTDMVDDFFCDCPIGYAGKLCDKVADYCSNSPCMNGGWCESFGDSYTCHCQDTYTGLNCELPTNQVCGADESYCTCTVNGRPVRVSVPQAMHDNTLERDLKAGIIGYPIGLVVGMGCCALYHYLIRRRCSRTGSYRPRQRPGSSSSTRTLTRGDTPVTPTNIQPNIYRSGFSDETIFKTGEKMNENSYISGRRDW